MRYRTSLGRVRGLGAAKSGTEHWWQERVTSAAGIPLVLFLIWLALRVAGRDHAETVQVLGHPLVTIGLMLSLSTMFWHMKLGMQAIIEDYVHGEGAKVALIMLNTFFAVVIGGLCLFAILKIAFAG